MKFEEKHVNQGRALVDGVEVERGNSLRTCRCGSMTRWGNGQTAVCSEECLTATSNFGSTTHVQRYATQIREELLIASHARTATKDILIVVHDQLQFLKQCIDSVRQHTENYKIYVWDNASGPDVQKYLDEQLRSNSDIEITRSEVNLGFIQPNNELVGCGSGEYVVLLNSDTEVFEGWADAMLGLLQTCPDVAAVGFGGGLLDETGKGQHLAFGRDIDFVAGWCLCFPREIYERFGLFSKQLRFAYGEDADFCLRLKEAGFEIYALHAPLVYHEGNKTIKKVQQEGVDIDTSFRLNHEYIRLRWADYLRHGRVLVRKEQSSEDR